MKRKRRNFTKEQKAEYIRRFKKSGLSLSAFSKKVGISENVLRNWIRKATPKPSTPLVRVRVVDKKPQRDNQQVIEIALSNGRVIRVPQDFDEKTVTRLVTLLEQC